MLFNSFPQRYWYLQLVIKCFFVFYSCFCTRLFHCVTWVYITIYKRKNFLSLKSISFHSNKVDSCFLTLTQSFNYVFSGKLPKCLLVWSSFIYFTGTRNYYNNNHFRIQITLQILHSFDFLVCPCNKHSNNNDLFLLANFIYSSVIRIVNINTTF